MVTVTTLLSVISVGVAVCAIAVPLFFRRMDRQGTAQEKAAVQRAEADTKLTRLIEDNKLNFKLLDLHSTKLSKVPLIEEKIEYLTMAIKDVKIQLKYLHTSLEKFQKARKFHK